MLLGAANPNDALFAPLRLPSLNAKAKAARAVEEMVDASATLALAV